MEKYEIIVIGGGPAGITLAKILGKKKKVGVIRPEDHSMIYCAMPYAIEGLMPMEKVFKKDALVTDAGADLIRGMAISVSFDEKIVTVSDGNTYQYDKLIIAIGAEPLLPPINGTDLKNVFVFKTQNDLERVEKAVKQDKIKKAVVVGAGAIGIELTQALNHVKVETHLVDMAPSILPNLVDTDFSKEVQQELVDLGIYLHLNSSVSAVEGDDSAEGVSLADGTRISLDGSGIVVFAVGMRVNTDLFKDTDLEIGKQGIVINNEMKTNISDVYAVGDCTQFVSGITGELMLGKLATNAVPMARMLAKNLLGDDRVYKGFYNGAATKVGKYFIGGTGFSEGSVKDKFDIVVGHAELTTAFPIMPNAKMAKMKLIADRTTLKVVGGQVVAEAPVTDKVDIVTLAIQAGLTVKDLTSFSYSAQPYQSFFPANNLVVACAEDILMKLKSNYEGKRMLFAIATDEGLYLNNRHFGDSARYDLYNIEEQKISFQETIINPFRENKGGNDFHGDEIKASNMKELFLEKGVSVLVSKRFGPNIKRMVKNFVPVTVRHDDVKKANELLMKHFAQIDQMLNDGQNRKQIILE